MKIKTNLRAGSGTQKQKGSATDTTDTSGSINNTVVSYVPPVSRCVGI